MRRRLIALTVLSAFALGACGIKGDLKTPPPLWGDSKASAPSKAEPTNKSDDGYFDSDDFLNDGEDF